MNTATLIHLASAIAAVGLGAWQLAAAKRGLRHRGVGYAWMLAMALAAGSSFWLKSSLGFDWLGGFSPIHALSAYTLVALVLAIVFAIRRDFARHRRFVVGAYSGLAIAGVFAIASPGRALNSLIFVELPRLLAGEWSGALLALI